MPPLYGRNLEKVDLFSVETDDAGIDVFDNEDEATKLAKSRKAYVIKRVYVFDGIQSKVADFTQNSKRKRRMS